MSRIVPQAQVVVMTGYADCQLHYQGFQALVIAEENAGYRVRDLAGQEYYCNTSELLLDTPPDANQH
ncbi:MAG: hypothetical protein ACI9W6_000550 [Motiliproteus sp.]|jgi:hypothetical protein